MQNGLGSLQCHPSIRICLIFVGQYEAPFFPFFGVWEPLCVPSSSLGTSESLGSLVVPLFILYINTREEGGQHLFARAFLK